MTCSGGYAVIFGSAVMLSLPPGNRSLLLLALVMLLAFFSKEPDKYQPGQGECQKPNCFSDIRGEHGDRQRQCEDHWYGQALGAQGPCPRTPDGWPQQPSPAGCVPPVGRGGERRQEHRDRIENRRRRRPDVLS